MIKIKKIFLMILFVFVISVLSLQTIEADATDKGVKRNLSQSTTTGIFELAADGVHVCAAYDDDKLGYWEVHVVCSDNSGATFTLRMNLSQSSTDSRFPTIDVNNGKEELLVLLCEIFIIATQAALLVILSLHLPRILLVPEPSSSSQKTHAFPLFTSIVGLRESVED